jgi:MtN3 and saliva related transmembrane protein
MVPLSSPFIEVVGYVAGVLTTVAFLPQVIKTWRSGSADDLSTAMLAAFTTGIVLWTVYGVALGSWPIVISNVVTLALTGLLLIFKLRHSRMRRHYHLRLTRVLGQPTAR